jgi:hypothetical protein
MEMESDSSRQQFLPDFATRLAELEATQDTLKEQMTSIFKGETFFFKKIQWFGSVVLAALALGGSFTYVVNTSKISDALSVADGRISNSPDDFKSRLNNAISVNNDKLHVLDDKIEKRMLELSEKGKIRSAFVTNVKGTNDVLSFDYFVSPDWSGTPFSNIPRTFQISPSHCGIGLRNCRRTWL